MYSISDYDQLLSTSLVAWRRSQVELNQLTLSQTVVKKPNSRRTKLSGLAATFQLKKAFKCIHMHVSLQPGVPCLVLWALRSSGGLSGRALVELTITVMFTCPSVHVTPVIGERRRASSKKSAVHAAHAEGGNFCVNYAPLNAFS